MTELLLSSSLRGLILAAVVFAAARLFRVRSPSTKHLLACGVLVGLLVLPLLGLWAPVVTVPLPAGDFTEGAAEPASWVSALVRPEARAPRPAPEASSEAPPSAAGSFGTSVEAGRSASSSGPSLAHVLWGLYLLGVVFFAVRLLRAWGLARSLVRSADTVDDGSWVDFASEIAGRRVRVAENARVRTPLATGWLRPTLLLPRSWSTWSDTRRRWVVTHEALHVRRGDYASQLVSGLVKCLYWFHPVPWVLARLLPRWAEQACDEGVLRRNASPREYARCLLDVAADLDGSGRRLAPVVTALGSGSLEPRIAAILRGAYAAAQPLRPVFAAGLVLLLTVGVAGAATLHLGPTVASPEPSPEVTLSLAESTPDPTPEPLPLPSVKPAPTPSLPTVASLEDRPIRIEPLEVAAPEPAWAPFPEPRAESFPSPTPEPTPAPGREPVAEPGSGTEAEAAPAARYTILFFDDPNRVVSGFARSQKESVEAVRRWLDEHHTPESYMAVAAFRQGLRPVLDFSNDPEQIARALDQVLSPKQPSDVLEGSTGAPSLFDEMPPLQTEESPVPALQEIAQTVAEELQSRPGARQLLLFTAGLRDSDGRGGGPTSSGLTSRDARQFHDVERLATLLEQAGLKLHLIHVRGHSSPGPFGPREAPLGELAVQLLEQAQGTYHPHP